MENGCVVRSNLVCFRWEWAGSEGNRNRTVLNHLFGLCCWKEEVSIYNTTINKADSMAKSCIEISFR